MINELNMKVKDRVGWKRLVESVEMENTFDDYAST